MRRQFLAAFMVILIVALPASYSLSITGIRSEPGVTSAQVSWSTDQNASSTVRYGLSLPDRIASTPGEGQDHLVEISGLTPGKIYNYEVISRTDAAEAVDNNQGSYYQFTTGIDYAAPVAGNISLTHLTSNAATLEWVTDEESTSIISYGAQSLNSSIAREQPARMHSAALMGLINNTLYSYKIRSCDREENCVDSPLGRFFTSDENDPPEIVINIPAYYNSNRLDLVGTTEPFTRLMVYIDDVLMRALRTEADGAFRVAGLPLDVSKKSSRIKIVAIDQVGFQSSLEREISVDVTPPIVNMSPLPAFSTEPRLLLQGNANEEVTVVIENSKIKKAPAKVQGLRLVSQRGNSAEITWNALESEGYLIYRNSRLLTSFAENAFIDPRLNRSSTHTYEVAAYSSDCEIGPKSDPIIVPISSAAAEVRDSFTEYGFICDDRREERKAFAVRGAFTQVISLHEGINLIRINATDRAGNLVQFNQDTILDTVAPEILSTNLDEITPSYVQDITIKGTMTKKPGQKVLITAIMNGEEKYTTFANEDGSFSMEVDLQRKFASDPFDETDYDPERRDSSVYTTYEAGWINKIEMYAESESGLRSEKITEDVQLVSCGYGSWWGVKLDQPSPSMLTPRLMLEGVAQIGIPVQKIQWQGGTAINGTILDVEVTHNVPLSDKDKGDVDVDYIRDIDYIDDPRDHDKGIVLVKIKKLDTYQKLIDEARGQKKEQKVTTLDLENALSDHRRGDCITPGIGCIRIPLMMEIQFAEKHQDEVYIPNTAIRDRREVENKVQRQCWNVEIDIDQRAPSDKIPKAFLEDSIRLLNNTITAIESIVKPLNTIKEVVFYSCAGSIVLDFIMAFQESYNCEFSEALNTFSSQDQKWEVYYAQAGLCEEMYEDEQKDACLKCESSVRSRKNFEKTMKWVCDRIFCPSAPTFQKYVEDMTKRYGGSAANKEQLEFRSDCALPVQNPRIKYSQLKEAYDTYKERKGVSQDLAAKCKDLHEPDPECCAFEYMEQWDSACLIMDELKESKCLAHESEPAAPADEDCTGMRKVWNSVAGFCEPDGTKPAEVIPARDTYKTEAALEEIQPGGNDPDKKYVFIAGDDQTKVWFRPVPDTYSERVFAGDARGNTLKVEIGYISSDISNIDPKYEVGQVSRVSTQRVFMPLRGQPLFDIDISSLDYTSSKYNKRALNEFMEKYKSATGSSAEKSQRVYQDLQQQIGVIQKDYIVDPTSSLLRSFQCACLPGMTSYLNLWKNVLKAVKVCFQTVLITGDGSAGICKETLSIYVCDLAYDLISCFTKKYGSGNVRPQAGLGSFFGALTSAGTRVSNTVANRYGDSPIYKSLFSDRKIVHAVCLWAFTGTWDFDVSSILEEDISIDVKTVAALYPCTRRYVSFNPATNPEGLTTYNYHLGIGMVAGSQLSYNLQLVCSNDYSCDTPTGACDCVGKNIQTISIPVGRGTALRGETIEDEVLQNIVDSKVRYDKAVLSWNSADSSKSGKQECELKDVGGQPPAFCQLDIAEGRFRCDFGFKEDDYIHFFSEPIPLEKSYYTGDMVRLDLRISQRQPAEVNEQSAKSRNDFTKFLQFKIFNQNGYEIRRSPFYELNGNGMHEFTNFPGYEIREADFELINPKLTVSGGSLVKDYGVLSEPRSSPEEAYFIVFDDKETYHKETREVTSTPRRFDEGRKTRFIGNELYLYEDSYWIKLRNEPKAGDQIRVSYSGSTLSRCDDMRKQWTVEVTLYDRDTETTDPSEQISVYKGQKQSVRIPVNAYCKKPSELRYPQCPLSSKLTAPCTCGSTDCLGAPGSPRYCKIAAVNGQNVFSCEAAP